MRNSFHSLDYSHCLAFLVDFWVSVLSIRRLFMAAHHLCVRSPTKVTPLLTRLLPVQNGNTRLHYLERFARVLCCVSDGNRKHFQFSRSKSTNQHFVESCNAIASFAWHNTIIVFHSLLPPLIEAWIERISAATDRLKFPIVFDDLKWPVQYSTLSSRRI